MKSRRRLNPKWQIDENNYVTNTLGDPMGRAVEDENGEFYLTKDAPATFDALIAKLSTL